MYQEPAEQGHAAICLIHTPETTITKEKIDNIKP
jgi:hypothetical protein